MTDHFRRQFILLPASGVLLALSGCAADTADVQMDSPDMAAYVQLIMPARIEIETPEQHAAWVAERSQALLASTTLLRAGQE